MRCVQGAEAFLLLVGVSVLGLPNILNNSLPAGKKWRWLLLSCGNPVHLRLPRVERRTEGLPGQRRQAQGSTHLLPTLVLGRPLRMT